MFRLNSNVRFCERRNLSRSPDDHSAKPSEEALILVVLFDERRFVPILVQFEIRSDRLGVIVGSGQIQFQLDTGEQSVRLGSETFE